MESAIAEATESAGPQTRASASPAYSFRAVEIEINHDCNRACAYCPNSIAERKSQGRMPEELFVRVLSELRSLDYRGRISYHFYNEPLLSPDLDRFVVLTKQYLPQARIDIYTNGTLLDEARLRALVKAGVDKFTVTKHHGLKELPLERVFATLEPELRARVKLQNYREIYLSSRGGLMKVGYRQEPPPLKIPCFIPTALLIVTVNGDVVPCFEDFHERNAMGNLRETPLIDIWNSERYRAFREDLQRRRRGDHPVCRDCNSQMMIS